MIAWAALKSELETAAENRAISSVLEVSPQTTTDLPPYLEARSVPNFRQVDAADLLPPGTVDAGRFDLALVHDSLEHLESSAGKHLLARLRDLLARTVLVWVPLGDPAAGLASSWTAQDLVALGYYQLRSQGSAGRKMGLFRFDLEDYKTTPDWLNNRFWAHPERWDKERW